MLSISKISYKLKQKHVKNILLNILKNQHKNRGAFHPSIFINENRHFLEENYNITVLTIEHAYYTNFNFNVLYSNLEFSYKISTYDFIESLPF